MDVGHLGFTYIFIYLSRPRLILGPYTFQYFNERDFSPVAVLAFLPEISFCFN